MTAKRLNITILEVVGVVRETSETPHCRGLIQLAQLARDPPALPELEGRTFVGLSPWLSISLNVLIPSTRHGTILDTLESFLPKGWIVTLTVPKSMRFTKIPSSSFTVYGTLDSNPVQKITPGLIGKISTNVKGCVLPF